MARSTVSGPEGAPKNADLVARFSLFSAKSALPRGALWRNNAGGDHDAGVR